MKFIDWYIKADISNTKHVPHGYMENYYDQEFSNKNNKKLKILEIGIRDGSSLRIWRGFFHKSEIHGIDISNCDVERDNVFFKNLDAYEKSTLDLYEDNMFDYIIDDGPHTVNSQIYSINYWYKKLKPKGKLIIEDIGCKDEVPNPPESSDWALKQLINSIPESVPYKVFDLRETGQYDSILLEITKV